uniref:Uncharacterized protein n=1 Tax=candidate division WOR-3 bacterium TaxID=2052148 RepID=A0A7V0Z808_UNCW3
MNEGTLKKIQAKLELVTQKWWFFLFFILLQFIPSYTSKGHEWAEEGMVIREIFSNGIVFNCTALYPIFKIAPIILVIFILFLRNKVAPLFSVYVAITYVLFAFLQNIAVTEKYGLGIVTRNLVMFLIVATFWFWEALAKKNDFIPQKQPLWKYWVVPLAFLAFWFPLNPDTLTPDFTPIYLLTNVAGLAFCMMTPVYLAILTLYHPRINLSTLMITRLVGIIIGFYNMLNFINPERWWLVTLHIPLLIISIYGFILSFRKEPLEEAKRGQETSLR